jgi:hypothetical protein
MNIKYNVTGSERKTLVSAISRETNTPARYLGAPTFAYEVGDCRIDKDGTVTGEDDRNLIVGLRELYGFVPTETEYDEPAGKTPDFADLKMTEKEELGLGRERRDPPGEDGMRASDVPERTEAHEPGRMTVEIPLEGFSPEAIDNLTKIVTAKEALIKAALGAEDIPIKMTSDALRFPWFTLTDTFGEGDAYARFIRALCDIAKRQKRVTAKSYAEENDKFAMRLFLVRLGFVGPEYKAARKILLKNLTGNGSWKNGRPPEKSAGAVNDGDAEATPAGKTSSTPDAESTEFLADAQSIQDANVSFESENEREATRHAEQ